LTLPNLCSTPFWFNRRAAIVKRFNIRRLRWGHHGRRTLYFMPVNPAGQNGSEFVSNRMAKIVDLEWA
jgi:hypothetical protein